MSSLNSTMQGCVIHASLSYNFDIILLWNIALMPCFYHLITVNSVTMFFEGQLQSFLLCCSCYICMTFFLYWNSTSVYDAVWPSCWSPYLIVAIMIISHIGSLSLLLFILFCFVILFILVTQESWIRNSIRLPYSLVRMEIMICNLIIKLLVFHYLWYRLLCGWSRFISGSKLLLFATFMNDCVLYLKLVIAWWMFIGCEMDVWSMCDGCIVDGCDRRNVKIFIFVFPYILETMSLYIPTYDYVNT